MSSGAILDVVYVNYNAGRLLLDSVDSLLLHGGGRVARVIVVDNASRAPDAAHLAHLPSRVDLVLWGENAGFARAANFGAALGRAPYVLFLNPDTLVQPETVPCLLAELERRGGNALVGPRQFADEERAFTISPLRPASLWGEVADVLYERGWSREASLGWLRRRADILDRRGAVGVRALSGAALAVGRAAFDALGRFDERYFLYSEDADLCRRAHARGLPVVYLPEGAVLHWIERSTDTDRPRAEAAMRAARARLLQKHHPALARTAQRLVRAGASRLPFRRRRWEAAGDFDPGAAFERGAEDEGRRWVVELGRSPLFDNCLTAFPSGARFRIPAALRRRLFPGVYYARTAVEVAPGRWRERALLRFAKPEPAVLWPEPACAEATRA
jgi:GT2 family glycosyltransferase